LITLEHIYKTERETLKFRLLALVIVGVGLYFKTDAVNIWPLVALLLSYMVYAMSLGPFLIPRLKSVRVIFGMILIDAVVVNLGLYLAGGVRSYIFVLLPLLVIYYSMYFGYASSLFSATIFSTAYVVTAILTGDYITQTPYIAFQVIFLYLAALLSGYLSRRRLQEMKEKEELQEALHLESQARNLLDIARRLGSSRDVERILDQMVKDATGLFKVKGCLISLYDKDKANLLVRAGSLNPSEMGVSSLGELALNHEKDGAISDLLAADRPVMLMNLSHDKVKLPAWIKKIGEKGLLLVPLKADNDKIGFVFLFEKLNASVFNEDQIRLAEGYAEIVSRALADSVLHRESQQKIEQMAEDLKNAIRRLERGREPASRRELAINGLHLNGPKGIAAYDSKPLELSTTEFELLYFLAENAGSPVNHETLLRRVWGENYSGQTNVVDVGVHRLRRKLENSGARGLILTVRGIGYMLADRAKVPQPDTGAL